MWYNLTKNCIYYISKEVWYMCREEEKEMAIARTVDNPIPTTVRKNIAKALSEVEMIKNGKLPKKTARDFLKQSRKNK